MVVFLRLVLGFSLFLTGNVYAQNGEVTGQVTDVDGLPISGVEVIAGLRMTTTDDGGLYQLTSVEQSERVVLAFSKEGFAKTFGVVNLSIEDSDDDGIPDVDDACPMSDLRPFAMMGDRATGVDNILQTNGCTLQDEIFACSDSAVMSADARSKKARSAKNKSAKSEKSDKSKKSRKSDKSKKSKKDKRSNKAFQKCVKNLASNLKRSGLINKQDKKALKRTAKKVRGHELPFDRDVHIPKTSIATLDKTMVAAGAAQIVDADLGGMVNQDGFQVTFPPGSINAVGEVTVVITPIDVSTPALGAFPGDFAALDANDQQVLLETFSLMKVELFSNGERVNLNDGALATLEFLLPENTSLSAGDEIPLWFFDEEQGIWVEEGSASVVDSTLLPGRLAAVGTVSHFTWWNCDQPIATQTSISGVVVNSSGDPVPGVGVRASGTDTPGLGYNGTSYAQTNSNGEYCVNVKINAEVNIKGSLVSGGTSLDTNTLSNVPTGSVNLRCQDGGAQVVPDLVLAGLSCISGVVRDEDGLPAEGVLVQSTGGGFSTTDVNGAYCVTAPGDTAVTLFSPGFLAVNTTTAPGDASCADGNCTVAPDIEPPVEGTTACLTGRVFSFDFGESEEPILDPLEGAIAQGLDTDLNIPTGTSDITDIDGEYCVEGVPLNTNVEMFFFEEDFEGGDGGEGLEGIRPLECDGEARANSSGTPGTCGNVNSCVTVPDEICYGNGGFPQES